MLAIVLGWGGGKAMRSHPFLLALPGVALALGGLLSAWAAALHLTGGEKFDDHPWV
jgi:hypothetical protein